MVDRVAKYAPFFALIFPRGANRWKVIARSFDEDEVFAKAQEYIDGALARGEKGHHASGDVAEDMTPEAFERWVAGLRHPVPGEPFFWTPEDLPS